MPDAPPQRPPALLFTAFEPSGDEHASIVIAELKRRHPDRPIYAWGGPKMAAAGAEVLERTGDDAVMGVPGLAKIREHLKINARIRRWLRKHPVAVHVPVDSPAANDPVCDIAKARGCKVVHLVAPQIWAWGPWRINALRRRTDLLLCLFDFEIPYFARHHIPARYIGHMLFDHPLDTAALDARAAAFFPHDATQPNTGSPKIAIMPGSRPGELDRHITLVLGAVRELQKLHPNLRGVIACTGPNTQATILDIAQRHGGLPPNVRTVVADTDAVIRWCDLALVKSGTVTLQVARQLKPMVVFYTKGNPLFYLVGRTILSTKLFSLPNVLAHRRIVPEFIPHFGGPGRIVEAAHKLLSDPAARAAQRDELAKIIAPHLAGGSAVRAADAIEEIADADVRAQRAKTDLDPARS